MYTSSTFGEADKVGEVILVGFSGLVGLVNAPWPPLVLEGE